MNKVENKKRVFVFEEIAYTDLDENVVKVSDFFKDFTLKAFANSLYNNGKSLDMDEFARELNKTGKAEITDEVEQQLYEMLPLLWAYPIIRAIKETISKL